MGLVGPMTPDALLVPATIANGASLSGAVTPPAGYFLAGVQMPAAWTAAGLSFQAAADGTTFADVFTSAGVEVTVTSLVSQFITIVPTIFAPVIKVRSGTTGTPVAQGAGRTLMLIFKPVM